MACASRLSPPAARSVEPCRVRRRVFSVDTVAWPPSCCQHGRDSAGSARGEGIAGMDLKLEGKRALVTGASSGIGKETALALAREGVAVVVAGRNPERTEATARLIGDAGGRAVVATGDLACDDGANAIADVAIEALGGIDILVNNAGGSDGDASRTWRDIPPGDYVDSYNLN